MSTSTPDPERTNYRGRENEPNERVANERDSSSDFSLDAGISQVAAPAYDTALPPSPRAGEIAGEPAVDTKRQFGAFDDPKARVREGEASGQDRLVGLGDKMSDRARAGSAADNMPLDPPSPGVGPFPVQVFVAIVLVVVGIVLYLAIAL